VSFNAGLAGSPNVEATSLNTLVGDAAAATLWLSPGESSPMDIRLRNPLVLPGVPSSQGNMLAVF
jgi:hypothetical protein